MGKYRSLGTLFNRVFRNDLNANFDDIDTDLKAQKTRVDNLVVSAGNSNAEIVDARGGKTVLKDRLDGFDTSLTENTSNINSREFNVKYPFGTNIPAAKADGTTDDSAAILGAINYLQTNGGGTVKLPNGTYYVKGFVLTPKTWADYNRVTLEGASMHGTQIITDDNGNDILIDYAGYYNGTDRRQTAFISIKNLRLTCTATTKNILALKHKVTQYCDMENVWIEGFKGGAIQFIDAYDTSFYNVQIIKCGRAVSDTDYAPALGFYGVDDCTNALHFVNCRLEFLPIFGIFDNAARHIYFTNSKFEKMSLNLTSIRPLHFVSYREVGFTDCMFANSDHYLADSSSGITGSITTGTNTLTVNKTVSSFRSLLVGDFVTITGVTGTKRVTAISGLVLTLDSNADATVSNASVVGSYYIVDQGKEYLSFPSALFYDGYDIANNLIKSAKFSNCHFNTPSKTSTRWGVLRYSEFENVTFNGCEGGSVVDRCFNIYDEVTMHNVKMASYNDAKLVNLYGQNSNLKIANVKVKTGTQSLVTIRTGADNNNIEIGSIIGATMTTPVQADSSFYLDQANSKYFYLKNNKIKLLSYTPPVSASEPRPSVWMDTDLLESQSTFAIEYFNFGHNGKRFTLVYTGTGGSIVHNASYLITKAKANKSLANGDVVNFINYNGIWREV